MCRKGTPPGAKLRRGYVPPKPSDKQLEIDVKQEEVDNYCGRVPVNRLVLACHGIGQKLAVSNIAHDVACMRLIMRQLSQVGSALPHHSLHLTFTGCRTADAGFKHGTNGTNMASNIA